MNALEILEDYAGRFHGVDLQSRRGGTPWPNQWRARIVANKNERDEYRLEAFGGSAAEALHALNDRVLELQGDK